VKKVSEKNKRHMRRKSMQGQAAPKIPLTFGQFAGEISKEVKTLDAAMQQRADSQENEVARALSTFSRFDQLEEAVAEGNMTIPAAHEKLQEWRDKAPIA
jgi:hypothetical protein